MHTASSVCVAESSTSSRRETTARFEPSSRPTVWSPLRRFDPATQRSSSRSTAPKSSRYARCLRQRIPMRSTSTSTRRLAPRLRRPCPGTPDIPVGGGRIADRDRETAGTGAGRVRSGRGAWRPSAGTRPVARRVADTGGVSRLCGPSGAVIRGPGWCGRSAARTLPARSGVPRSAGGLGRRDQADPRARRDRVADRRYPGTRRARHRAAGEYDLTGRSRSMRQMRLTGQLCSWRPDS